MPPDEVTGTALVAGGHVSQEELNWVRFHMKPVEWTDKDQERLQLEIPKPFEAASLHRSSGVINTFSHRAYRSVLRAPCSVRRPVRRARASRSRRLATRPTSTRGSPRKGDDPPPKPDDVDLCPARGVSA